MEGVVAVAGGLVRGAREGALWVFRGVRYAGSPARDGRWRLPRPVSDWAGVHDAVSWGPIAPQNPPIAGLSIPGDPVDSDEDCLNLNVWTPGLDDRRRPVLVWIHGGGFTTGSGSSALFAGDRMAATGDVVVVTFNYRLGALGFLAHPALCHDDESGRANWGLHDQVRALEWVHENVGAFGGDPLNVTVFGESAGAMSISALLASHACGTLFHRAVLQSGPPATATVEWGRRRAERLVELAGGGPPVGIDRGPLERLEPPALVRGAQELAKRAPSEGGLPLPLLPVVEGDLLSRPPADAIADGSAARVPLLVGTTRDEAALFIALDPSAQDLDTEAVMRRLRRVVTQDAARSLVELYSEARDARGESTAPRDLLTALTTDFVFRLPTLELATAAHKHQQSTFAYLFTWESPFLGGIFGSSHGLDIPFVFGSVHNQAIGTFSGTGPEAFDLSEAMQQAWLAFARTGNPSCDAVRDWPAYDPLRRPTMIFGPHQAVEDDPRGQERSAWDQVGVEIGAGHHHESRD